MNQNEDEKMDTASSINSTSSNSSEFESAADLSTKMLDSLRQKPKLTLTTNHPLMAVSPDDKYDDSLSSIEADKTGYSLYSQQTNNSKSNLYVSEYVTAELMDSFGGRRKIKPNLAMSPETPDVISRFESRIGKRSTPKVEEDRFSEATEWCDSPSNVRAVPNFDLPIEMSSGIKNGQNGQSDIWSYDKSAYVALMDVYSGSVALRPAVFNAPPKRKIQIPPLDDSCSIGSDCSIESEPEKEMDPPSEDETQRSKSTATASECSDQIPEYSASDEYRDERSWLHVQHSGVNANCDMKVIEPFKRVISHGGYSTDGAAIIVFSACFLPDNARPDYRYVMDNLFLYVIWSLERLVTDEYILVYLHGSAVKRRMPTFAWLHECYKLIDRRLRKNLKQLYLVHPTFWLKSFVVITKPFVSSKFFRKLNYVKSLDELFSKVAVEPNAIPESVKHFDTHRSSKFFRKLNYVKSLDELFSKVAVEPNAIPESVKHFDTHRR